MFISLIVKRYTMLMLLVCFGLQGRAQMVSCGKEFFLTQHAANGLLISIVSKHAAAVRFHFFAEPSTDTNFILTPNVVCSIKYHPFQAARFSSTWAADSGKVENRSMQICADSDIIVYYGNGLGNNEDATLLYPVLQTFSDTATYFFVGAGASGFRRARRSAMIVSHHDGTKVEITPKAPVGPYAANIPFTLTLNKGDIFNLTDTVQDMSGSTIKVLEAQSRHPITLSTSYAVNYLRFPWYSSTLPCCADVLVEQNLPVANYDTLYHFVPFMMAPGAPALRGQDESPGVVRILSAADSNKIYVDGDLVAHLNKGQMFDTILLRPRIITATYPIAVSQFAQSHNVSNPPSSLGTTQYMAHGDPDQLWLNPLKMGIKESIFKSFFPTRSTNNAGGVITTLTLITTDEPTNITLNNTNISGLFQPFQANPKYRYAQLIIDNIDTHHLLSDKNVVAYVTSFAWQGGMSYALGDLQSAIVDTPLIKDIGICDTFTLHGREWGTDFFWSTGDNGKEAITVNAPGTYWVTSYTGDCTMRQVTDTFHLFSVSFLQTGLLDTTICSGDSIVLDAYRDYFLNYLWSTGDTSHTITVGTGAYFVTAAAEGCKGITDTIVVSKLEPPYIEFPFPDDTVLCKGTSITVGAQQEGITYLWSNGVTGCCIAIAEPGYYKVTATSAVCGEQISDSIRVDFYGCESCLFVPSAFTPNADGLNDVFRVRTNCILRNFKLNIFNRWGQLVYSGNSITDGWDGNYKGMPADLGVYYYQVTAESVLGEIRQLGSKGDVTLIR